MDRFIGFVYGAFFGVDLMFAIRSAREGRAWDAMLGTAACGLMVLFAVTQRRR